MHHYETEAFRGSQLSSWAGTLGASQHMLQSLQRTLPSKCFPIQAAKKQRTVAMPNVEMAKQNTLSQRPETMLLRTGFS